MSDQPIYRYKPSDDGSYLSGVPQRDLTARDVARLRGRVADVKASPLYAPEADVETDPHKMKRDALNIYAVTMGIANPEQYPNKEELLKAIEQGSPPPSGDPTPPESNGNGEEGGEE